MENDKIKEIKTADYTRRAVDNYHNKKDLFSLALRKGTKDAIKEKHGNIKLNDYFQSLVDADLNGDKKPPETRPETTPKKAPKRSADLDDPALIFENYKN